MTDKPLPSLPIDAFAHLLLPGRPTPEQQKRENDRRRGRGRKNWFKVPPPEKPSEKS